MDLHGFRARVSDETGLSLRQLALRAKMKPTTLYNQLYRSKKIPVRALEVLKDYDLHYLLTGMRLGERDPQAADHRQCVQFAALVAQYPAMRTVVLSLAANRDERQFIQRALRRARELTRERTAS